MTSHKNKGFTLIELMITVAILGIIAAIAIPSYAHYITKSKRTDAKVELLRIAQLQESYFVQNLSYAQNLGNGAGGLGLGGATINTDSGYYSIGMATTNANGAACIGTAANSCASFTLTATAAGNQTSDTPCLGFTISNTGEKGTVPSATAAQIRTCWD